ncbi:MAG: glutamate mutase L [Thermodesulfobacteriota bacterium]
MHLADGDILIQRGKDLTELDAVIGTGGPLIFGPNRAFVLQGALFDRENPLVLKPLGAVSPLRLTILMLVAFSAWSCTDLKKSDVSARLM